MALPGSWEGVIRDDVLGRNGAAFAALGDMVVDFFGADAPLPESRDGVKLGESTLNRFLLLGSVSNSDSARHGTVTSLTGLPC